MPFLTIKNAKIQQQLGSDYATAHANVYDEYDVKTACVAYVADDDVYEDLYDLILRARPESYLLNKDENIYTTSYREITSLCPDFFDFIYYGTYYSERNGEEPALFSDTLEQLKKVAPNFVNYFDNVTGSVNQYCICKGDYEIYLYKGVIGFGWMYQGNQIISGTSFTPNNLLRASFFTSSGTSTVYRTGILIFNKSLSKYLECNIRTDHGSSFYANDYVLFMDPHGGNIGSTARSALQTLIDEIGEIGDLPSDPYEQGGGEESDTGGGGGSWDDTSDPIDYTPKPNFNVVNTGFIKLYNPDITMIKDLANYMWNPVTWDPSTWQNLFADPMDAILGLNLLPVTVPNGATTLVTVGNMATSVGMPPVTEQFVEVDCGTIDIAEYWGSYLDYAPYTKAQLYLPYCGIHEISADEIMGKTLGVKYVVDVLSGACRAEVKCGESVLYQFLGQCAASIPTSGRDWGTMINGVITAAVSIGSMVATGGMAAPLAAGNLASAAVNIIKPSIEKSGAMSGPGGLLCRPVPYLILTLPVQCVPGNQNKFTGYPSYITRNLGGLSGYTEIESVHLRGIPGTEEEINEIERLLKEGVIL